MKIPPEKVFYRLTIAEMRKFVQRTACHIWKNIPGCFIIKKAIL